MALKPLDDALRDGDTIRAVVRGSGINQDGDYKLSHLTSSLAFRLIDMQAKPPGSLCRTPMLKRQ